MIICLPKITKHNNEIIKINNIKTAKTFHRYSKKKSKNENYLPNYGSTQGT